MNQTHAQAVLTDHTLERATAQGAWHSGLVGLGVFFVAMGIGLLVERLARGGTIDVQGWRPPAVLAVLAAGAVGLAAIDLRALVLWEHVAMAGPAGLWYLKLLVLAGGAGWMLRGSVVRREFALCAAAALALVCLRGPVWDYYFIDLAALGFFGGTLRCAEQAGSAMASAGVRRLTQTALVTLAVVNALLVLDFKASLDRAAALCFASEQALRDGRLQPEELYFMPFGFTAWHLYPYYIQHEGRTSAQIDGFNALYPRPDAMQVGQGYSRGLHLLPRFRHVPPSDRHNLVAEAHTGFLWFFRAGYYILRFKTAAESPAPMRLQADFRPEPFPLSEAEWKQLIAGSLTVPAAPARQP